MCKNIKEKGVLRRERSKNAKQGSNEEMNEEREREK